MTEEITSENKRISNFEGLVTLTLDQVTLHTIVHHLESHVSSWKTTKILKEWIHGHSYGYTKRSQVLNMAKIL